MIQRKLDGLTSLSKAENAVAFFAFLAKIFMKACVVVVLLGVQETTMVYQIIPINMR